MKLHPTHKRIPVQALMTLVIASCLLLFSAQAAWSGPGPAPVDRISSDAKPVPDETLNQMRGGFAWGGMNFSFGIQSSTFVNGTLMVNTILQTVGKNLLVATGSNPLGNAAPTKNTTQNTPAPLLSVSSMNSSGTQKPGNLPQVIFSPIQNLSGNTTLQSSQNTMKGSYGMSVQVAQAGSGNVANLIAPSTFDNASGIISVLQNAASNLVIHNIVTMNATVSHVGAITHTISLNNLLQSSRFLSR